MTVTTPAPGTSPTTVATSALERAAVLTEALPYIRRFAGQVIVVKFGGAALVADAADAGGPDGPPGATGTDRVARERAALARFASDIVLLHSVGLRPLVVHGGGPQIGEMMRRLGKVPEFRDGLRVTDAETLDIARMVLVGKVNRDIVAAINVHGPLAVGLSGEDAGLITAAPHGGGLGFVGRVQHVNPDLALRLIGEELIPVIATIGADASGQAYNINADTAAGAVAEAVGASKLIYLTDVEGVRADATDPASLVRDTTPDGLEELVASGAIGGGMIPKVTSCLRAVRAGVERAHILDGRADHALLLELFTTEGVGTMVSVR